MYVKFDCPMTRENCSTATAHDCEIGSLMKITEGKDVSYVLATEFSKSWKYLSVKFQWNYENTYGIFAVNSLLNVIVIIFLYY